MANYTGKYTQKRSAKAGKKPLAAVLAVVLAVGAIFGGTFAWQSISQEALNEVTGNVNPGGRLHDDFNNITEDGDYKTLTYDKNVYVENFTSLASNGVQVFARVRLDEYMEIGKNAGQEENNEAVSLVAGAVLDNKSTWKTHIYGEEDVFHQYWNWDQDGGSAVYMPTFNKNKDSLEADINGTFDAQFTDYQKWNEGDVSPEYNAIYDADAAADGTSEVDELAQNNVNIQDVISGDKVLDETWDKYVTVEEETHTAKSTLDAFIIPMSQYIEWLNNDDPTDDRGNFWVYDTDGWAYWANPIDPDTATGLLLDGISRTETIINEDWYYGINVVAQFVTGDDLGQDDNTGFYDVAEGLPPTEEALLLLNAIGVDVTFEANNEETLAAALAHGGTVKLADNVTISEQLEVKADTVLDLGGYTIAPAENSTLWSEGDKTWSLISVKGKDTVLTINSGETGTLAAAEDDSFCVDVRDGAKVIINGGTFKGNISAVYVHTGEAVVTGGTFSIMQTAEDGYAQMLNCYDENYKDGTAKITVTGGTFREFNPESANDGDLVPTGYQVTSESGIYTVTRTAASETEAEVTNE